MRALCGRASEGLILVICARGRQPRGAGSGERREYLDHWSLVAGVDQLIQRPIEYWAMSFLTAGRKKAALDDSSRLARAGSACAIHRISLVGHPL